MRRNAYSEHNVKTQ